MLIKWIRADAADRDAFDRGQRGWSAIARSGPAAVLVLSWWPDLATHEAYRRERVPHLRETARTTSDVASVDGDLVALEPAWTVGDGGVRRPRAGTGGAG